MPDLLQGSSSFEGLPDLMATHSPDFSPHSAADASADKAAPCDASSDASSVRESLQLFTDFAAAAEDQPPTEERGVRAPYGIPDEAFLLQTPTPASQSSPSDEKSAAKTPPAEEDAAEHPGPQAAAHAHHLPEPAQHATPAAQLSQPAGTAPVTTAVPHTTGAASFTDSVARGAELVASSLQMPSGRKAQPAPDQASTSLGSGETPAVANPGAGKKPAEAGAGVRCSVEALRRLTLSRRPVGNASVVLAPTAAGTIFLLRHCVACFSVLAPATTPDFRLFKLLACLG